MANSMKNEEAETEVCEQSQTAAHFDPDEFPKDCENPFENPFCESDMVLVVEGKKLYVHKNILSVYSPVFHKMFYGDFAEKETAEIEIKNQKHQAMVVFLKQMYPVHSHQKIADDTVLEDVLPLADYYQSQHILVKCEDYIGQQAQTPDNLSAERKMMYLQMCDTYRLNKHFDTIMNTAAKLRVADIKKNYFSGFLKPSTQLDLLTRRCEVADGLALQTVESAPGRNFGFPKHCEICLNSIWICRYCTTTNLKSWDSL